MTFGPDQSAPEISVIVPFHNSEEYLDRCLQGLIGQSLAPTSYELLMVDNNSTDRSAEIAASYPGLKLLHEKKQGAYAARNQGVAAARGRILAFTDADCLPSPDWLKEMLATFADPGVGLVQGRRVFGAETPALSMLAAYEAETAAYIFSGTVQGPLFGYTNNMAVLRKIFDRCGPFVETARGADSIFVDRVVQQFSHRTLRYARGACIRHLELTRVRQWLGKKAIYGRSFQLHRNQRPLHRESTRAERSLIFKRTIQTNGYSVAQAAWLFAAIWTGRFSFIYGRLTSGRLVTH